MDVPQVEISTAKAHSQIPRTTHTRSGKELFGIWSALASDFYLEISGERTALCASNANPRTSTLEIAELKRIFKASYYAFQPITVVLHPPTVCIKTFSLDGGEPSQWLAEHLHEVFPPGDRRQMRLVSAACREGQLLVAVMNRAVLNNISQAIWQAGGSIKAIVPAVASDLAAFSSTGKSTSSEWALVRYEYETREGALSIWPSVSEGTNRPRRLAGQPCLDSPLSRQLDFLPQLKVAKSPTTRHLVRAVRASLTTIIALLFLTLVLYLAGSVYRSVTTTNNEETSKLSNRVTALQEQNRDLRQQLGGMRSTQSGKTIVGRLLHAIAQATPDDTWLQRLEVQKMSDGNEYELRMSGLSRSDKSPATFAAALAANPEIAEASLSRVGKGGTATRERSGSSSVIEFDLQGKTRADDHD